MAALIEPLNKVDIQSRIDKWHEEHREPPRAHLGLSLLGHPCNRWIWLSFRWAVIERFSGRMLRLLRRGHHEELTIVEDLRAMGIDIHHTEADGEQTHVDFGCHVSGSVDGIIESGVPGAEKTRHIAEFKTYSLKSFRKLQAEGVYGAKRQHWWQMQGYMLGTGINRALYIAVCKDNDEMYTERVPLNEEMAKALIQRGYSLALSENLPEPVSMDPNNFDCRFCPAREFCFSTHLATEINCRTCAHSTPTPKGKWLCSCGSPYEISTDHQRECHRCHVMRPELTPWKFKGSTEDNACAIFEINGQDYINGEPWRSKDALTSNELLVINGQGARTEEVPF